MYTVAKLLDMAAVYQYTVPMLIPVHMDIVLACLEGAQQAASPLVMACDSRKNLVETAHWVRYYSRMQPWVPVGLIALGVRDYPQAMEALRAGYTCLVLAEPVTRETAPLAGDIAKAATVAGALIFAPAEETDPEDLALLRRIGIAGVAVKDPASWTHTGFRVLSTEANPGGLGDITPQIDRALAQANQKLIGCSEREPLLQLALRDLERETVRREVAAAARKLGADRGAYHLRDREEAVYGALELEKTVLNG